jgi:hypothetical protein
MIENLQENRISSVIISIVCVGIILFILFTQCEISNIRLKPKDASLLLIFIALLAYINGYEKIFLLLLFIFVVIYFTPTKYIEDISSLFITKKQINNRSTFKKLDRRSLRHNEEQQYEEPLYEKKDEQQQPDEQPDEQPDNQDNESQANTEITLDIDIDDEK